MSNPRLQIDSTKIAENAALLIKMLKPLSIDVVPVTKVFMGHPVIARLLIDAGATTLADSRIENVERMRRAGIKVPIMLIRTPMLSQVEQVVLNCNVSLNTELSTIQALSSTAKKLGVFHQVIIMVELGDLREGVMPDDLIKIIKETRSLPHISLKGIGANLTCRYGIAPDHHNMAFLAKIASEIETKFQLKLDIISGGNSANLLWAFSSDNINRVNQLRLGESIYFGVEALKKRCIIGAHTDTVKLIAEVIESNRKPSMPWGKRHKNAFGEQYETTNRGDVDQAILALGRQDVDPQGLISPQGLSIVSSSSDHIVIESTDTPLQIGQEIEFKIDYVGLLSAMTSPYVNKYFT
ncbi:alanine racemase [Pseudoalteromonas luteoviolacea]|uniref:Alanine racemase n=1 Tax=Pseudoalteromonas luteoviolacea DSM 6061 TaxID=1365250 RepID=A0A166UVD8_9GAMM|nr:alanine/ornithine racemase family PLP-dependent enzyme [Pseudoalteromonas luteoviolacea]KZN30853.1 alanine racemase [Pseudoalteromonas luteoviolacea DSM 6061]KZN53416.1 alanine racemase [Pseudoalteromonas luteoviolacea CPMOR-2]KZX00331.1 alanine racemase [Pseudoalteromonas luteoviolacea]MBE0386232.1 hypothetical protein [Pseudoalteromonas luteoviolacea DSM 6061]